MNTTDTETRETADDHLEQLAEYREEYERLARMDLPISDEAQRVVDALDEWDGGQS